MPAFLPSPAATLRAGYSRDLLRNRFQRPIPAGERLAQTVTISCILPRSGRSDPATSRQQQLLGGDAKSTGSKAEGRSLREKIKLPPGELECLQQATPIRSN